MKNTTENTFILNLSLNKYTVRAWGGAPETYLIKIERSLSKAVRIMQFKGNIESAQPLFQYLNIVLLATLKYQSSYNIQSS